MRTFGMAIVEAAALAMAWGVAMAQDRSVHLMAPGTVVKESFTLVDNTVPLPEGEFVFVASQVRDADDLAAALIQALVR